MVPCGKKNLLWARFDFRDVRELLERRYPNEFALRSVSRPDTEQKQAVAEIPAEILARHRKLQLRP